jgi:hypothetical protein
MFLTSFPAIAIAVAVVLFLVSLFWRLLFKLKNPTSLPPGPKGLPIVGNLFDLPPKGSEPGLHWLRHKDLYGMCGLSPILPKFVPG